MKKWGQNQFKKSPIFSKVCIVAFAIVAITTLAWSGIKSSVMVYEYINKSSNRLYKNRE